MALHSDAALQSLWLKKQETSLLKAHKYESLAEKLINGNLEGKNFWHRKCYRLITLISEEERKKIQQEYKIIKNQLNYHLVPLKNETPLISWNSQMLSSKKSKNNNNSFTINDLQLEQQKNKSSSTHLPSIYQNQSPKTTTESETDSEYPSNVIKLPPINS